MISVICLQWGDKYDDEYVSILFDSVQRNMTVKHEFICFTERSRALPCTTRVVEFAHEGWWNKLQLFSLDVEHCAYGRIMFIDLDVVITGNLDCLASIPYPFVTAENWGKPGTVNSSFMLWNSGEQRYLYNTHKKLGTQALHGDQCFINAYAKNNKLSREFAPEQIISYKYNCRGGRLPDEARMVFFHGKPDPHEVDDEWVKEHWRCQNVTT